MSEAKAKILAEMKRQGLTLDSVFIPFSQSRNAAEKHKSLNWRVSLKRGGREIIETDYSAGIAHAPCHIWSVAEIRKSPGGMPAYQERLTAEIEQGFVTVPAPSYYSGPRFKLEPDPTRPSYGDGSGPKRKVRILPDTCGVVASLMLDSGVLDFSSFEQWAPEFGYSADSRDAERIYSACLKIALALRAGLGEDGLAKLREACADY